MKCDIIIPIWNHLEFTRDCINNIAKNTKCPFRLILIDNGSRKEAQNYLASLLKRTNLEIKIIRNETNLGFVKAVNQGLRESKAPYICVMNNDTIVTDGWLTELIDLAGSDSRIGLVNPSSNNLGQKPPFGNIAKYAKTLKKFKGEFIEMGAALGFCLLIKRDIFEKIGFFDEIYGVGNFDDTDYSRRVESLGFVCVRAKAAYVYHSISKSFNLKKAKFDEIFGKNKEIFNKRWGRPKRLLYIMTKDHKKLYDWIRAESVRKARFGNWVWLFMKRSNLFWIKEHSNVRVFYLPKMLFKQNCVFRILKRKKRFDSIYVDEDGFRRRLNRLKRFHNADVTLMGG